MANIYKGYAIGMLGKCLENAIGMLFRPLQYAIGMLIACHSRVGNEPALSIAKRAFRMLGKSYPWKHKRVDIITVM